MGTQILLAADGSERGLQAVSILGGLLKDQPDCELTLLHCVQQLAAFYPEELGQTEESYVFPASTQEKVGRGVLEKSRRELLAAGFPESRVRLQLKTDSADPAQDILREAERLKIRTVACGRRGRGTLESLLLGSVSSKVAQYGQHRTVWIVDAPVHQTQKVLVAMEGVPDSRALTYYTAEFLASIPGLHFTFLHIMPPVPPTFWDDGHILGSEEQKDREARLEKWRSEWMRRVEKFLAEARDSLRAQGVAENNIATYIEPTKEGIARDLLNDIEHNQYQVVVMGKRSFHERKPFLMGSHANKVLQNIKGAVLCLVDAP